MKKINITILLFVVIIIVGGISAFVMFKIENQAIEKRRVYLVVKTIDQKLEFWLNVVSGARVAAKELGVEVIIRGPEKETMVDDQIAIMEEIIKEKPEAIALAACDYHALGAVSEAAVKAGITLVTVDSDVEMISKHSLVATDNQGAAKRIGHELAKLMDEKGQVAIVAHIKGASTAFERTEGFKMGLQHFKEIELIGEPYYTNNNEHIAYKVALEIVETHPEIKAIFAANEVTLLGVAKAVRDLESEKKILVVGFDMNEEIATLIEQEVIDATMVQKPFNMGYTAVKEALEVLDGKEVEEIDTGVALINRENMFLPENQKLIVPVVK